MSPRGMRVIEGEEARVMSDLIHRFQEQALRWGYEQVMIPSVWEQEPFVAKAGPEILGQMYTFPDKKGRPLVLIPEVTAIIQELWRERWSREGVKRIFYVNRCYRYERPQAGRYREFTQFGVEFLTNGGDNFPNDDLRSHHREVVALAESFMKIADVEATFSPAVKRGLDYYTEDGFEFEVPTLGAQKQVLGGGRYEGGIGFAVGIDRLVLAMMQEDGRYCLPGKPHNPRGCDCGESG